MDDVDCSWAENVGPLLDALEVLGINPVYWAADHDFAPFFKEGTRELVDELSGTEPDQIFFACGYMQATGNLTSLTWADQIAKHLAEKEKAGYHPDSERVTPMLQRILADGEVHSAVEMAAACYGEDAPPMSLADVTHILHEMQATGQVVYISYGMWRKA